MKYICIYTHISHIHNIYRRARGVFCFSSLFFTNVEVSLFPHSPFLGWLPICNNSLFSHSAWKWWILTMFPPNCFMMLTQTDLHKKKSILNFFWLASLELFTQALLLQGINLSLVVVSYATTKFLITQIITSMSLEHAQKILKVTRLLYQNLQNNELNILPCPGSLNSVA